MHLVRVKSAIASLVRVATGIQRWRERGAFGPTIVNYHGVVDRIEDPLLEKYCIDTRTFSKHLCFLKRHFQPISLRALNETLKQNSPVPADRLVVTLDDAMKNQVVIAASILSDHQIPFTLAVPAGLIDTGRGIWANELAFLIFRCWDKPTIPIPDESGQGLIAQPMRNRKSIFEKLRAVLFKRIGADQSMDYLRMLISQFSEAKFFERYQEHGKFTLASWQEINDLANSGVEIVSHGWHHLPHNETLSSDNLERETVTSKQEIFDRTGIVPSGFSLPHGEVCAKTHSALERAGYEFCLTSNPRRVKPEMYPFSLPRFDGEYPLTVFRHHLMRQ